MSKNTDMRHLNEYTIQFVGLKLGEHTFEYKVDDKFFEFFEYDDFNTVAVNLTVTLNKKPTLLEFYFDAKGLVNVNCDITNEPFDYPLEANYDLVVKFGQEFNDDNEDIIIIPYGEYEINIAQYIYELIVLAMPSKRIHPGVADGSLKSEILDKLEELSIEKDNRIAIDEEKETDPRWDKLKKLLTDK